MSKKRCYFKSDIFIISPEGRQLQGPISITNQKTLTELKKAIQGFAKRFGATVKKTKNKPFVRATLCKMTEEFNDGVYRSKVVGRINEPGYK